jgi:hypothetical protein
MALRQTWVHGGIFLIAAALRILPGSTAICRAKLLIPFGING